MPEKHIFEESELTLNVKVKRGKSKSNKAQFKVLKDGEAYKDASVAIESGKAQLVIDKLDKVADDKANYCLEYSATVDEDEYPGGDTYTVWPRKIQVEAVDKDDKAVKGVEFLVTQDGADSGKPVTGAKGTQVHFLAKPAAFSLGVTPPYLLKEWLDPKTGRKRKARVEKKVVAEFVKPQPPESGDEVKQWVNLPTSDSGRDHQGHEIEFEVGVKGENPGERGGASGDTLYIQVKFAGKSGDKSKRNDPVTELKADGLDGAVTKEDDDKTQKGKIKLGGDQGTCKFKVCLGLAGGDTCEVKIGGTDACADATFKLVNWRKLYYEIMAPDFATLSERDADEGGGKIKDFPTAMLNRIKSRAGDAFFEYQGYKSHIFTEADAPEASVFDSTYFKQRAGSKVYVLTDHTFKAYPKAFDKGKDPRCIYLKLCDKNYYFEPGRESPTRITPQTEVKRHEVSLPANRYFLPKSAGDGSDAIKQLKWKAVVDKSVCGPALETDFQEENQDGSARTFKIEETQTGNSITIAFDNPTFGHIATDLSSDHKAAIDTFLAECTDPANVRPHYDKVKIKVTGSKKDNTRRSDRADNVMSEIDKAFNAHRRPVHPGLDDNGDPLQGTLLVAAVKTVDYKKFAVELPDAADSDPGKFVGAMSTTQCPIKLTIKYEGAHSGLGLAGSGAQKGENLMVYVATATDCSVDTLLHELGHSMGMTITSGANKNPPGTDMPKSVSENDGGSKGNYYTGKGHSGAHCAFGLSDGDKGAASYGGKGGTCIMFGEGPSTGASKATSGFCTTCRTYINARDLRDLTKNWTA